MKTHKPAGSVSCRLLHDSSNNPFQNLARWINFVLGPAARALGFLSTSTPQLLKQFEDLEVHSLDILTKGDVAEFYMSGGHLDLAWASASYAPANLRGLVEDVRNLLPDLLELCASAEGAVEAHEELVQELDRLASEEDALDRAHGAPADRARGPCQATRAGRARD